MKPLLCLLLAALTAGCGGGPEHETVPPNFVFILVDDLGWRDLGCYGSSFYETPNIDRLAEDGTRFTDAYAACPVCSPTRASIMTGKYPARTGITDWIPGRQSYIDPQPSDKLMPEPFTLQMDHEEITIAEALKAAGYQTFFAGKWHLGEDSTYWPEYQGFDINKGGWGTGYPRGGYFSPYQNPRLESGPDGEHLAERLAAESQAFLEKNNGDPFFLYLSFYSVHTPLQAKDSLIRKYEKKSEESGLSEMKQLDNGKEWIRTAPQTGNYVERVLQGHPVYAGMIETMDACVGLVLDKLAELGMEKNTVVFLMSDNGGLSTAEGSPTSNLPLRAGKGWLYEGGIREPMIVRWPGIARAGSVCDVPVTSTDFYPTILDMAGLDPIPGQHVDGLSLVPLLRGERGLPERSLFWHYPHYSNQGGKPGAAIRSGRFKLIEFFEDNSVELYDLQIDIGELNDLSEEMPEKTAELLELLHDWQAELGARMMKQNPAHDPDYVNKLIDP